MDFCMNLTVSTDQILASSPPQAAAEAATAASTISDSTTSTLEDLLSAQNMVVDVSLEWLSVFVEDCLTSTGNCVPLAPPTMPNSKSTNTKTFTTTTKNLVHAQQDQNISTVPSLERFVVPSRARSKRKRVTGFKTRNPILTSTNWSFYGSQFYNNQQSFHFANTDPPLLQQAHWLADSELIMPQKHEHVNTNNNKKGEAEVVMMSGNIENNNLGILDNDKNALVGQQQPRRCTHCLSHKTPQWRAGPLGPKTLCNACGVRYKSGRLLPEYRPAKSPTFVSFLHSNSHKKVLEMRNMATRG